MTDRQARQKLHHRLIDLQDKSCLWCGSKQDRNIDRITEGYRGGKYIMSNVRVLCVACHTKRHNKRKFGVGDKVQVNGRCPQWLVSEIRHNRLRTITSVYYNHDKACCYYYLGNNHTNDASCDIEAYRFRSYMLHYPIKRDAGRPKLPRKCTVNHYNGQQNGKDSPAIHRCLTTPTNSLELANR